MAVRTHRSPGLHQIIVVILSTVPVTSESVNDDSHTAQDNGTADANHDTDDDVSRLLGQARAIGGVFAITT